MKPSKSAFDAVVWALRIIVGGVFVMSGLVKMVDLYGFVFKIEEYLLAWGFSEPRSLVLMAAMAISGYEFVLGLLLAMGCYKRTAPWGLMLSMIVMLPLTFYIMIENPVSDCGCFGEFWVISNTATFVKNIFLTVAIGLLIAWNHKVKIGLFKPAIQWLVGAWITLYIIIVGLIGYNIQPMLDFRPYPIGTSLAGTEPEEETEYAFIYEKDGIRKEFSLDEEPDSTWTFVDRIETGENAGADKASLAIFDGDEEVTSEVIETEGEQLILVIPEPIRADVSFTYYINEIYQAAEARGIPMIGLLAGDENSVERWRDLSMASYPLYTAEDTQLKELSRGVMSLVVLDGGTVKSKAAMSFLVNSRLSQGVDGENLISQLSIDMSGWLRWLTLVFSAVMLLMYLFQGIILAVKSKIWRKFKKKNVTLQSNSGLTETPEEATPAHPEGEERAEKTNEKTNN